MEIRNGSNSFETHTNRVCPDKKQFVDSGMVQDDTVESFCFFDRGKHLFWYYKYRVLFFQGGWKKGTETKKLFTLDF